MDKKPEHDFLSWVITTGVILAVAFLLFGPSLVKAEEIEMRLKVANGTTEREHSITDPQMTVFGCMITSQVAGSKWIAENLGPNWRILRITCGPMKLDM